MQATRSFDTWGVSQWPAVTCQEIVILDNTAIETSKLECGIFLIFYNPIKCTFHLSFLLLNIFWLSPYNNNVTNVIFLAKYFTIIAKHRTYRKFKPVSNTKFSIASEVMWFNFLHNMEYFYAIWKVIIDKISTFSFRRQGYIKAREVNFPFLSLSPLHIESNWSLIRTWYPRYKLPKWNPKLHFYAQFLPSFFFNSSCVCDTPCFSVSFLLIVTLFVPYFFNKAALLI